ncbi:MAG: hypothetical protein D3910_01485 [Candidatus Electrothrix sp. ATG2]|nr:hypothetical protein [Candidatus Electrothrix sp. ATG2]
MEKKMNYSEKEDGFVLVAALLILLVLTVMGIAVNRNTELEWRIAMNDRDQKDAFYKADAATELASEVLDQIPGKELIHLKQALIEVVRMDIEESPPGSAREYQVRVRNLIFSR